MGVPAPTKMVEAFAKNAPVGNVPGGKTVPFPVASQIPLGQPGRASLDDGFTIANMTPLAASGQPMSGPDTNGIFYLMSTLLVALSAGNTRFPYDGTFATAISGYDKGAQVQDATDKTLVWTSAIAANTTSPAVTPANWISSRPLYSPSAPSAGTFANNVLPGPSDFILDVDVSAGNVTFQGFVPQRDGQRLTLRKKDSSANVLTIAILAGAAGNQLQYVGDIALAQQYASATIMANSTLNAWVVV